MVEPIIFSAIGFLLACLMWLTFIPLVHKRAVRLTARRVQAAAPSMREIIVQKDHLRAEFAVAARRLEQTVEQMKAKIASQHVELGIKSDMILKLKNELGGNISEADRARERVARAQTRNAEEALARQINLPLAGSLLDPEPAESPASAESDAWWEAVASKAATVTEVTPDAPAPPPAIQTDRGGKLSDRIRSLHHFHTLPHVIERTLDQISNTARSGVTAVGNLTSRFSAGGIATTTPATPPKVYTDSPRNLSDRLRTLHHIRALPQVVERTFDQVSSTARSSAEVIGSLRFRFGAGSGKGKVIGEGTGNGEVETTAKAVGDAARPATSLERALQICKASNVFDQGTSETIQPSLGILGELKRSA